MKSLWLSAMHKWQFLCVGYSTVLSAHRRESRANKMFLQREAVLKAPDSGYVGTIPVNTLDLKKIKKNFKKGRKEKAGRQGEAAEQTVENSQ